MERSTASHLVSKPCNVVILQQDSQQVVDVKKSFACSTDLEIITDHAGDLSSCQESIDLLCLLLLHVDSSLEIRGQ